MEVLREEGTVNEIVARHGINPVMLLRWEAEFLEQASDILRKQEKIKQLCVSIIEKNNFIPERKFKVYAELQIFNFYCRNELVLFF